VVIAFMALSFLSIVRPMPPDGAFHEKCPGRAHEEWRSGHGWARS